jgi:hypothetical protein
MAGERRVLSHDPDRETLPCEQAARRQSGRTRTDDQHV